MSGLCDPITHFLGKPAGKEPLADFSILIPFHNEEKNLSPLVEALQVSLQSLGRDVTWEVLLVDDASTDSGLQILRDLLRGRENFYLHRLSKRGGQTEAFRLAFQKARGRYFLRMDADLQDNPKYIPLFVQKMKEEYDLIMGVRVNRKHILVLLWLTHAYDALVSFFFRTGLVTNSGSFIAFKAKYIRGIPMKKNDHRYLPLIAHRRGAHKTCSLLIPHRRRIHGATKYPIGKKVFFGIFEMAAFYVRLVMGYYDGRKAS